METTSATDMLLSEGVILLGAAVAFVMLFRRFGLGAVLGYLVAGALVGPQGLGLVGGGESKLAIAEIGIVLLLFLVGLELHPARLWRLKRDIFALGLAQVVTCGCVLTAIIFYSTGFSWGAAIALGLPLALSSTAQVLPGLKSSGRINSPRPCTMAVPPRRKNGTSDPSLAAIPWRVSFERAVSHSRLRPIRAAAASLLPPPSPADTGMDFCSFILAP